MKEIGQRLKAEREAKGISLKAVEDETKIRRKYLEALEEGREADMPGEVYLKGFLRTYGNFLGLDGTALVDEYKERKRARRSDSQDEEQAAALPGQQTHHVPQVAPAVWKAVPGRATGSFSPHPPSSSTSSVWTVMAALLVLALVAAVGYFGWQVFHQLDAQPEPAVSQPDPVPVVDKGPKEQPDPEPPPPKLPDPPAVSMTRGSGEDVIFTVPVPEVTVRFEPGPDPVWVRATVDGEVVHDGSISEPMEFKGQAITLRVGHMIGVSLEVNGQRFEEPLEGGPYTLIFEGQ